MALFSAAILASVLAAREARGPLPDLEKMAQGDRLALLNDLARERQRLEGQLLTWLGSSSPDVQMSAAYLLGKYRMTEGLHYLVPMIGLRNPDVTKPSHQLPIFGEYPVYAAVVRIGPPALPQLMKHIAEDDEQERRRLCALAVHGIYGKKIAIVILGSAETEATDPEVKARFAEAIRIVETHTGRL